MVFEEIRRQAGDECFRCAVDEAMKDFSQEECIEVAHIFERSGFIDFFNGNYGRMDTLLGRAVDKMPGMASPIAPWLQSVGAFKREVDLPVFAARITDIATARYAIQEGLLDMVAMTRAHIAGPQLVNKLADGREDEIWPCVGATKRPVCLHNAAMGRELKCRNWSIDGGTGSPVVGGGPAGLEAARVLGERGHDVTFFEAAVPAWWAGPHGFLPLAWRLGWRYRLARQRNRTSRCGHPHQSLSPKMFSPRTPISLSSRREGLAGRRRARDERLGHLDDGTAGIPLLQCAEHAVVSGAETFFGSTVRWQRN